MGVVRLIFIAQSRGAPPSERRDQGFTLIELLIVVTIVSIVTAIAAPGLLRARMTSNETSAIASMKVTTTAQATYAASCGVGAFASNYVVLGTPPPAATEGFISNDLGSAVAPQKTGYGFTMAAGAGSAAGPNDCNGAATITAYYASGAPHTFNTTGARSFAVSTSGTIWQVHAAVAPAEPFGPPATPLR